MYLNRIQRYADRQMAYLGKAWRIGFWGPRDKPTGLMSMGSTPPELDNERVHTIHANWLRVAAEDEYLAALLKLRYRDEYNFPDDEIREALDLFSKLS